MHIRNLHKDGYDFDALVQTQAALGQYIVVNPKGRKTIDFGKPASVKALNSALLKHYYSIDYWDIPKGYLCPPVPGRADYIHALADLLSQSYSGNKSTQVKGFDIGTGANLIYPIIGSQSYGWKFVASDIDSAAIKSASLILSSNAVLRDLINIRLQSDPNRIFESLVHANEKFDFCMCNPPFHSSKQAALLGSVKKNENLKRNQFKRGSLSKAKLSQTNASQKESLNFEGQSNELWCKGGEVAFIRRMISQSVDYQTQFLWFTSLVSKKDSLKLIYKKLKEVNVAESKTINMGQGNKVSRIIAWRF